MLFSLHESFLICLCLVGKHRAVANSSQEAHELFLKNMVFGKRADELVVLCKVGESEALFQEAFVSHSTLSPHR